MLLTCWRFVPAIVSVKVDSAAAVFDVREVTIGRVHLPCRSLSPALMRETIA